MIENFVLLMVILFALICFSLCFYMLESKKNKLKEIELYDSINFAAKNELLDSIVKDEFDVYCAFDSNLISDEPFLNEKDQNEMIRRVTINVYKRITPAIRANISLIYNFDSSNKDEQLINIIAKKVSLLVLEFSLEVNRDLDE
jgi:hypothetical protein